MSVKSSLDLSSDAPAGLPQSLQRRRFFKQAGVAAAAGAAAAMVGGIGVSDALAMGPGPIPAGDVAILQFLAAAELLECDLWGQYCELATGNPGFHDALCAIDPALPRYICDDANDECSHAALINSFLLSIGQAPVNLDGFRTLPSVKAQGAQQIGRLTNLRNLNVDTSWFNRYRGIANPDLGDMVGQFLNIRSRSTVPQKNNLSPRELQTIAHCAAFHFCAIEQGGGQLYTNMIMKAQSPQAKLIIASIGPTEVYHFAGFHKSLEGLFGLDAGGGLVFPDLRSNPGLAHGIFPKPCRFFSPDSPLCSVIRPVSRENAGAVAAALGLAGSGLFAGQSTAFINAAVGLAQAADNA